MSFSSRHWGWAVTVGLGGAALLVLMTRGVVDHPVHYDELLHILSARGLVQTGQPFIAEGFYTRAELFTRAVAWSFQRFGDSPVSARLPALIAGALLVFLMGAWVVRKAGLFAGACTAFFLCVVPTTVDVAVFARFYTIHAVLMALMFMTAFEVVEADNSVGWRVILVTLLGAFAWLGWHFQDTTIIAIGAMVSALLVLTLLDHRMAVKRCIIQRPHLVLGAVVLCAGGLFGAVWYAGLLDQLGKAALWAAGNAKRYQYYVVEFRNDLPLLWPLLPVAAMFAMARKEHRRLAVFCAVTTASALVVHSIAAQKLLRYVYYFVPLMCVLWAVGIANLTVLSAGRSASKPQYLSPASTPIALALLVTAFALSQEGARAVNLVAGRDSSAFVRPFAGEPDWTAVVPALKSRALVADYVVTSNSMKAMYYVGRYDFELNATIVPETETQTEFGRDRRTGKQVIGTAESIGQVLARHGTTLVILEDLKIGRSSGVAADAFAVIESRCDELVLTASKGVRAWWCVTPPSGPFGER